MAAWLPFAGIGADYNQHVCEIDDAYNPADKLAALERSMEANEKISIRVLYQEKAPNHQEKRLVRYGVVPLISKIRNLDDIGALIKALIE